MAANENYLKYSIENGARKDRSVVIRFGNMVETEHFSAPEDRVLQENDLPFTNRPFVLAVSSLSAVKKPGDILHVAEIVKKKYPELAFLVAGDGEARQELEKESGLLGLKDTVYLLGDRNQDWLIRVYPHAMAYFSPHAGRTLS